MGEKRYRVKVLIGVSWWSDGVVEVVGRDGVVEVLACRGAVEVLVCGGAVVVLASGGAVEALVCGGGTAAALRATIRRMPSSKSNCSS